MRIVAGIWRGRSLQAPAGAGTTRPTADRVRQALFDTLIHANWAESDPVRGGRILDAFAGTGALGLEGLSRGATHATFVESNSATAAVLRANIEAFKVQDRCAVIQRDLFSLTAMEQPCTLAFLDPPYGRDFVGAALAHLREKRWLMSGSVVVAEVGRNERVETPATPFSDRVYGAARIVIWQE